MLDRKATNAISQIFHTQKPSLYSKSFHSYSARQVAPLPTEVTREDFYFKAITDNLGLAGFDTFWTRHN